MSYIIEYEDLPLNDDELAEYVNETIIVKMPIENYNYNRLDEDGLKDIIMLRIIDDYFESNYGLRYIEPMLIGDTDTYYDIPDSVLFEVEAEVFEYED